MGCLPDLHPGRVVAFSRAFLFRRPLSAHVQVKFHFFKVANMVLSPKQNRFIDEYLKHGKGTQAATAAGYSAASANIEAIRLLKNKRVTVEIARRKALPPAPPDTVRDYSTMLPMDYLLAIVRDEREEPARRDRAAKQLLPYMHQKAGAKGKKDAQQDAGENAATGKYAVPSAPRLAVVTSLRDN
jgi:hypothetical protein